MRPGLSFFATATPGTLEDIIFTGGNAQNSVVIPTNLANALEFKDTAAVSLATLTTTTGAASWNFPVSVYLKTIFSNGGTGENVWTIPTNLSEALILQDNAGSPVNIWTVATTTGVPSISYLNGAFIVEDNNTRVKQEDDKAKFFIDRLTVEDDTSIGYLGFRGGSGGNQVEYANVFATVAIATGGAEYGGLSINTIFNGEMIEIANMGTDDGVYASVSFGYWDAADDFQKVLIKQNSLTRDASAETVDDDGTITLPTGVQGICEAWTDAEYIRVYVAADGTISLIDGSANTAITDSDGDLCIYDGGSGAVIKNRLGSAKTVAYDYRYF